LTFFKKYFQIIPKNSRKNIFSLIEIKGRSVMSDTQNDAITSIKQGQIKQFRPIRN
jgi:hypothetical protein